MPAVLVVDDEPNIIELIKFNLEKESFSVMSATDGIIGLNMARCNMPDVIILDLMLPGRDGFEVCRDLKDDLKTASIPIIMLSAKTEEIDKVLGLEIGAEDYVTKPFSPRELVARVKAILRHHDYIKKLLMSAGEKELRFRDMIIRPDRYEVIIGCVRLDLTPKEFELLFTLASYPGRIFTRDLLLDKIWGFAEDRETRKVDVHIRYLRQKIERDPANPEYIETVRGVGYRFSEKAWPVY